MISSKTAIFYSRHVLATSSDTSASILTVYLCKLYSQKNTQESLISAQINFEHVKLETEKGIHLQTPVKTPQQEFQLNVLLPGINTLPHSIPQTCPASYANENLNFSYTCLLNQSVHLHLTSSFTIKENMKRQERAAQQPTSLDVSILAFLCVLKRGRRTGILLCHEHCHCQNKVALKFSESGETKSVYCSGKSCYTYCTLHPSENTYLHCSSNYLKKGWCTDEELFTVMLL